LKGFVKYIFHVDYTASLRNKKASFPTVHDELVSNLVLFVKQTGPSIQDLPQTIRLLNNCWFFLELTLKSLCLYKIQHQQVTDATSRINSTESSSPVTFSPEFYASLKSLYELLGELIVRHGFQSQLVSSLSKDPEFVNACGLCNRSLAMFVKKSLNVLNRKFLFGLVARYLELFHLCDKQLAEIKFDFVRIVCNHEHYVAFSLPIRRPISNINEFADIKYEFVLSDQYRQFHFLSGLVLGQLLVALNESKEQRRVAIQTVRNLVIKHAYDARYADDKMKQGRIAALYIPLLDMLVENMPRMSLGHYHHHAVSAWPGSSGQPRTANVSLCSSSQQQQEASSAAGMSRAVSSATATSSHTLVQNAPTSASMSNGSVYAFNFDFGAMQRLSNDPLSAIAGLGKLLLFFDIVWYMLLSESNE
jgi:hypothetical protein